MKIFKMGCIGWVILMIVATLIPMIWIGFLTTIVSNI